MPDARIEKIEVQRLCLHVVMETQAQKFEIGDKVTYKDLDMEYYSRGYGISYETKTARIVSICYKLSNGDTIDERRLVLVPKEILPAETQKPPSSGQSPPSGQTAVQ